MQIFFKIHNAIVLLKTNRYQYMISNHTLIFHTECHKLIQFKGNKLRQRQAIEKVPEFCEI